ncbi:hypothetical protein [Streptomyces sp. NPDC052107]|uniref:hypothetical protein n=1 Tax=Streptomyces sp. NPDC052107 TaxID=3155632 RepID=UPI00342E1153
MHQRHPDGSQHFVDPTLAPHRLRARPGHHHPPLTAKSRGPTASAYAFVVGCARAGPSSTLVGNGRSSIPPENIRLADRIVVLRSGRVVEQGSYDDLVHTGGLFAELVALAEDR